VQGSRENLCVSDAAAVPAPLEAAWETIRTGLRRDCGARTFDGWLKPAELGAFDGDAGELEIIMPSQFMAIGCKAILVSGWPLRGAMCCPSFATSGSLHRPMARSRRRC
jgi:hypothetical protein